MRHRVTKLSHSQTSPSWEKDFDTKDEAILELQKWICSDCHYYEFDNSPVDLNCIADILSTPCGCEFDYEEIE